MTRKEYIRYLLKLAEMPQPAEGYEFETVYRRPWTHVKIYHLDELTGWQYGWGFAKVCYPDVWDEKTGRRYALADAARDMANHYHDA